MCAALDSESKKIQDQALRRFVELVCVATSRLMRDKRPWKGPAIHPSIYPGIARHLCRRAGP